MASAPKNKMIDKNGDQFFPITHVNAVVDNDGNTIETWLNGKQDTLVSGTNIKTINSQSLLGSGNIVIEGGGGGGGGSIDGIVMNGDAVTVTGGIADLGTVLTQHQDISGKADKVSSPTNGNFASLDSNGNLTDSGHKHSDYQAALVSGTNIKTINSTSLLGSGNISLGTYSKPSGGIPKTDLTNSVQASLDKADSALQEYTEIDPVFSASAAAGISSTDINNWNGKQAAIADLSDIRSGASAGATAYQKPSTGIPKTDLASEVQTSLGKADSALQSYTETDPTVPSWAKASSKPSYNFSEIGSKPTTISGYGITDAKIASGTITLGSNTITPLTSFTETDPVFSASAAAGISSSDISSWDGKQDSISDLSDIRSGAEAGATAYQLPSTGIPTTDLASAVQTSLGKADTALQSFTETDPVFSASAAAGISSSDITNWNGKTSNIGTITSVKMNGSTVSSSGEADLGTVITSHQNISGKADKVSSATNGNFAGLDSNGNLVDSGHKHADYLTSFTETDPTVPSWAKAASKPGYTLDEVTDGSTRKLSDYQPLDADLTAIAGLSGTSGLLKKTAANTWALDTNTYYHSGNSNKSDVAWSASSLTLNGALNGATTGSFSGAMSVDTITITNTSAVAHLAFSREGANYFTAPTNGVFSFVPAGRAPSGTNSRLTILDTDVRPGSNNGTVDLGTSDYRWKGIYGTTLNTTGSATVDTLSITNDTATAHLSFPRAAANYINIPAGGNLRFSVGGTGAANTMLTIFSSGNIGMGYTTDQNAKLAVNGNITASGTITPGSDSRIKDNQKDISPENAFLVIKNLKPKTWVWNEKSNENLNGKNAAGLVAQEVKEVVPDAVTISENGDIKDFHSLNYNTIQGYEIAAIKGLIEEVKLLKAEVAELKAKSSGE